MASKSSPLPDDLEAAFDGTKKFMADMRAMVRETVREENAALRAEHQRLNKELLKNVASLIESNEDLIGRFDMLETTVNGTTQTLAKLANWATTRRMVEEARDRKVEKLAKVIEKQMDQVKRLLEVVTPDVRPTPPNSEPT